ncbi:phosphonate metabolism transcriptional regulator PhnF [Okeania sp. SIO2C9]|uniref:phosphonate metabolism transcriptional regulator PhnF n=1 Tax=Okeania sp. SIO2C9 TaxID=2607791 RepID=UPI0025DBC683|nr:phosphonate metabolism transcriptional regulator PhnF [Okeania sp. SIO2C9]
MSKYIQDAMSREVLPVYTRIAEELRQNIHQGIYKVGDKLPTEAQLSEYFSVNRHTLRRAIAILKTEGLVRVDRGRGTFVVGTPIKYLIGKRVRYNQTLIAQGQKPSFRLLQVVEIPADASIAQGLEVEVGTPVALIERLVFADDQPINIASSHFPLDRFPGIVEEEAIEFLREKGSISQLLREKYNSDHIRRTTHVYARIVRHEDASLLEVPLNHPILLAESINVNQDGNIIEYGVTRFRGDRMELVFENE